MKLLLYRIECLIPNVSFLDADGNVVVPKSVRPIIDYDVTVLGERRGCVRQYRYGNLHVREYDTYYSVHVDNIDPRVDPIGHLMIDTPLFMKGILLLADAAKRCLNSSNAGK
jgi:hypothetical protein